MSCDNEVMPQQCMARRLVQLGAESRVRKQQPVRGKAAVGMVWLYVVLVLATWLVLHFGGDRWWFATLMLFGPRWIYGLPLVLLVPLAIAVRRRLLWPLGISTAVLIGPIMGYCVPWSTFVRSDEPVVRIVTWNVRNECVNSEILAVLINSTNPDIVALQECQMDLQLDWPAGWHVRRQGRLITASPYPIDDAEHHECRWPPREWPPADALRCVIQTPNHRIGFVNVHLRTPRQGIEEVLSRRTLISPSKSGALKDEIEYRRQECKDLADWINGFSEPVVIAGDFNMPADSSIYRQAWSKYANAFAVAGFGFGHTKRTNVLGWQYESRIDHVLTGAEWRPCGCWIGPDLGSDHLPLIADLCREGP